MKIVNDPKFIGSCSCSTKFEADSSDFETYYLAYLDLVCDQVKYSYFNNGLNCPTCKRIFILVGPILYLSDSLKFNGFKLLLSKANREEIFFPRNKTLESAP
jgi:hypothetical protein